MGPGAASRAYAAAAHHTGLAVLPAHRRPRSTTHPGHAITQRRLHSVPARRSCKSARPERPARPADQDSGRPTVRRAGIQAYQTSGIGAPDPSAQLQHRCLELEQSLLHLTAQLEERTDELHAGSGLIPRASQRRRRPSPPQSPHFRRLWGGSGWTNDREGLPPGRRASGPTTRAQPPAAGRRPAAGPRAALGSHARRPTARRSNQTRVGPGQVVG
jgi:hypothetical protein